MSQLTTEEPLDRVDFIKITNAMQHQFHKWYKFASKRQEQKKQLYITNLGQLHYIPKILFCSAIKIGKLLYEHERQD